MLERLIGAPPGLPADIKAVLASALSKALADPAVVAWAKKATATSPETPDRRPQILADQVAFFEKWKPYLKASN